MAATPIRASRRSERRSTGATTSSQPEEQRLFAARSPSSPAAARSRPPRRSADADLDTPPVARREEPPPLHETSATGCSRRSASSPPSNSPPRAKQSDSHDVTSRTTSPLAEDVDERRKVGEYELGPIEEERDNLRSAFDTALALDPEQALELAARLGLYWNRRGLYREGRQRLAAALAAAPAARASARARALSEAGNLALWQADLDAAEQLGREALALAREHGDRSGSGYALNLLGMIATDRDPSAAVELYEESLAEYEAAGDETGRLTALQNLASNALARGDNERAISLLRERVAGTRGRDTYSLALAIGLLGFALAANGESEEARQSFEESLEICRVHGFSRAEAEVLGGLADLMRTTSPARALEYYRESIELAWEMGYVTLGRRLPSGHRRNRPGWRRCKRRSDSTRGLRGVRRAHWLDPQSGGTGRARRDDRPGPRSAGERCVRRGVGRGRRVESRSGGRALAHRDGVTSDRPRPDLRQARVRVVTWLDEYAVSRARRA